MFCVLDLISEGKLYVCGVCVMCGHLVHPHSILRGTSCSTTEGRQRRELGEGAARVGGKGRRAARSAEKILHIAHEGVRGGGGGQRGGGRGGRQGDAGGGGGGGEGSGERGEGRWGGAGEGMGRGPILRSHMKVPL